MKQTNKESLDESRKILDALKEMRGGTVLPSHKRMANDPALIETFAFNYDKCKAGLTHLDPKVPELILMALGLAKGAKLTVKVHGNNAYQKGASIEEISEVLRLVMFYCGASSILDLSDIFDEIDYE